MKIEIHIKKPLDLLYGSKVYFRYGQKVERRKVSDKKKMGRPTIENPRTKRVEIRLNEEELNRLDELAKKYKTDRANLIRMALKKLK